MATEVSNTEMAEANAGNDSLADWVDQEVAAGRMTLTPMGKRLLQARRRIERGSRIAWGAYLIAGTVLAKVLFP